MITTSDKPSENKAAPPCEWENQMLEFIWLSKQDLSHKTTAEVKEMYKAAYAAILDGEAFDFDLKYLL